MSHSPSLTFTSNAGHMTLTASGSWTAAHSVDLEKFVADAEAAIGQVRWSPSTSPVSATSIRLEHGCSNASCAARPNREAKRFAGVPDRYAGIVEEMHLVNRQRRTRARPSIRYWRGWTRSVAPRMNARAEMVIVVEMLGAIALSLLRVIARPRTFRLTSAVHHLYRVGWQAIPIIVLITFLIGASSPSKASSISASSAPNPMWSTWSASSSCAKSAC